MARIQIQEAIFSQIHRILILNAGINRAVLIRFFILFKKRLAVAHLKKSYTDH
jgi:hypothetical protein